MENEVEDSLILPMRLAAQTRQARIIVHHTKWILLTSSALLIRRA